jgi:hypothetical protein
MTEPEKGPGPRPAFGWKYYLYYKYNVLQGSYLLSPDHNCNLCDFLPTYILQS